MKYRKLTLRVILFLYLTIELTSCAHREKPITFRFEDNNVSSSERWGYPLKRDKFEITSGYGDIRSNAEKIYYHQGVDIKAEKKEPVYAVLEGKVLFAGRQGSYGKIVILSHKGGWETRYAHLDSIFVRINQWVRQGEVIGTVGMTGNATGYHLHFEIRRYGVPQNPVLVVPYLR